MHCCQTENNKNGPLRAMRLRINSTHKYYPLLRKIDDSSTSSLGGRENNRSKRRANGNAKINLPFENGTIA
jgi:hypothetical protein